MLFYGSGDFYFWQGKDKVRGDYFCPQILIKISVTVNGISVPAGHVTHLLSSTQTEIIFQVHL